MCMKVKWDCSPFKLYFIAQVTMMILFTNLVNDFHLFKFKMDFATMFCKNFVTCHILIQNIKQPVGGDSKKYSFYSFNQLECLVWCWSWQWTIVLPSALQACIIILNRNNVCEHGKDFRCHHHCHFQIAEILIVPVWVICHWDPFIVENNLMDRWPVERDFQRGWGDFEVQNPLCI